MLFRATLILLASLIVASAHAADLELMIHCPRRIYVVGEKLEFQVVFKNVSEQPIRILPEVGLFDADLLGIRKLGSDGRAEYIRPQVERAFDSAALSDYVVLLKPQDSLTRAYHALIALSLPAEYERSEKGLFLLFDTSAIRLPGPGKYEVRADYDATIDTSIDQTFKNPVRWRGKVHSASVVLTIKGR